MWGGRQNASPWRKFLPTNHNNHSKGLHRSPTSAAQSRGIRRWWRRRRSSSRHKRIRDARQQQGQAASKKPVADASMASMCMSSDISSGSGSSVSKGLVMPAAGVARSPRLGKEEAGTEVAGQTKPRPIAAGPRWQGAVLFSRFGIVHLIPTGRVPSPQEDHKMA